MGTEAPSYRRPRGDLQDMRQLFHLSVCYPLTPYMPLAKGCFTVKGNVLRRRVAGEGRGQLPRCGDECGREWVGHW